MILFMKQKMKILTFNVLAQRYYDKESTVQNGMKYYEWDYRLRQIINAIVEADADIICLQEVEINTFNQDYVTIFTNGYKCVGHEINDKRTSPIGNFVFWKSSKFDVTEFINTSCANIITLKDSVTNEQIKLANVHLRAGMFKPDSIKTRVSQFKSICKNKPDIICGDLNDNFSNNPELVELIDGHKYVIHNNYHTCYTYDKNMNDFLWCFDNILTLSNVFNVKIKKCPSLKNKKIPDDDNPSDHLPLMINLERAKKN